MIAQNDHSLTNTVAAPFNPMVSVCDNVYDVANLGQRSLLEVFDAIRGGFCAEQISVIRAVLNGSVDSPETQARLVEHLDHVLSIIPGQPNRDAFTVSRSKYYADSCFLPSRVELVGWLKRALPGVLFSGLFTKRSRAGFQSHSGLICIDIDDLPDAAVKRDEMDSDPHCMCISVSPSGTGLKIVMRVPPTSVKGHSGRTFPAAAAYLLKNYSVVADNATSDVSRLCYLPWDPDIAINPSASELEIPETGVDSSASASGFSTGGGIPLTPGDDYNAHGDVVALLRAHDWKSNDKVNWTRPGKESGKSASLGEVPGPPRSLWVFSSNAAPFLPNKRYEPWRIFSMLECGGDNAVAYTKLRALGYGTTGGLPGVSEDIILPTALGISITDSAQKIFSLIAASRTLFSRGGVVHEVVSGEKGSRLAIMTSTAFRSRLEKYGPVVAWRYDRDSGRKLAPALCSEETASALLVTTQAHDLLPSIRSVVASPVLALAEGELTVLKQGWNSQNGGVFVTGGEVPPDVQLDAAVGALLDLLGDFDFQSEGDCSRALAALITPALKAGGLLACTTPIEVCEADKSQSGKGFFLKVLAAMYAEIPSLIAQKDGGVGSLDESIASALIAGRPFIQLDNMRGKVSSQQLEAILTANGPFQCRAPHRAPFDVDTRPFTFSMTSNGVVTTRDLANRCSIIRIRKQPEDYEFQTYEEGGLHDHIIANQPYYLGCVFAVVREWIAQGRKRTNENRHDFREWAQTLDWIVTTVFGSVPLIEGHNAARDRVSDQGLSWLRAVTLQVAGQGRLGEKLMAMDLVELSEESDVSIPNCREEMEGSGKAQAVGRVMRKLFADGVVVNVDSWQVTRDQAYSPKQEKNVWHYRFTLK